MVEDLVVLIQFEILLDFTNAWELILKEIDIAKINFYHGTIGCSSYIT